MPPQKQVDCLFDLSFRVFVSLVSSSFRKIEDECEPPQDLETDGSCKTAIQSMKTYLHGAMPTRIWYTVIDRVLDNQEELEIKDLRIPYTVFVQENIPLWKCNITFKPDVQDYATLLHNQRFELWLLEHTAVFANIVEADFSCIENLNIIPFVCKKCVRLVKIRLPKSLSTSIMKSVFKSCPKLREIKCRISDRDHLITLALKRLKQLEYINCPIPAFILRSLYKQSQRKTKLKLTKLILENPVAKDLRSVCNLCPHLKDLSIDLDELIPFSFAALKLNSLNLDKFSIYRCQIASGKMDPFRDFLTGVGDRLTQLEILKCKTANPIEMLIIISDSCKQLKSLRISFRHKEYTPPENITVKYSIKFPVLETLRLGEWSHSPFGIEMAHHCMEHADMLTSLELEVRSWCEAAEFEACLSRLYVHPCVRRLTHLRISCDNTEFSKTFVKQVYEACTNLRRLEIEGLTDEAADYVVEILDEVRNKNLDLEITVSF